MAQRTAVLDYRTSGTSGARSNVISLAEATERQKRAADALAPALQRTTLNAGVMGAMFSSATARISSTTNTLGPLGAGLGAVARLAPMAGLGLVQMAAGAERASLMSRALNTTMLVGVGTMIAGGVAAVAYADDVIRAGDAYATLQARIRTFTDTAGDAVEVESQLFSMARNSRAAVMDLTTLYVRLAPAMKDVGRTQADALKVTELTSKALAVQGADIREQAASTVQLSQALASGRLRGDELRSLMEAAPQLMRFIAQGMNVPFSALRKMGEEGKLTTDKIVAGLLTMEGSINAAFATAPKTAAQGWQVLQDQIMRTVGSISQATGLQQGVFDFLDKLATRSDDFRIKVLADPSQLDALKETANFLGDAVGLIGQAGSVAVTHFDDMVKLGAALIALKLGETLAIGFTAVAARVKGLAGDVKSFVKAAQVDAGAVGSMLNAEQAAQSIRLKALASIEDAKASEMATRADRQAKLAADLRAQADRAATQAILAKASGSVSDAAAASAEAAASQLNTRATRAKDAADRLAAQAASQKAVATAAAMEAQALEAAVTARATALRTAGNVALRAATALYTLLGGAVGIASLAVVGAMMLMANAAAQAKKEAEDFKAALDLLDELNQETADSADALADGLDATAKAADRAAGASRRHAAALADERKELLLAGIAAAEKRLQAAETEQASAQSMGDLVPGEAVDSAEARVAGAKYALERLRSVYIDLAAKGSGGGRRGGSGTPQGPGAAGGYSPSTSQPAAPDGKPKRVTVPAGASGAAQEVIRQEYLPKAGLDRFTMAGGSIRDATTGETLKARSEDEAAAAAVYVKALTDINTLTDAQVAKLGQSREALRQAASARLAYAIATSQAAQSEDKWADMLAEASGESRVTIKAEREIEDLRARGAAITDAAAAAYIDYVRVREAAKKAAQAVDFAAPLAKDAADQVMAGTIMPTRADGAVDLDAAVRQIEERRAAIVAETEASARAEMERLVLTAQESREQSEALSAGRIAAARVAVETELQDRILKLTKQRADDQAQIDEARASKAAGAIEGAFHDLVFGGDFGDIGKRLVNDLLETIYQDLIGNPMRKLIQDLVRDILHPKGGGTDAGGGGGGSGLVGSMLSWAGQAFGFDDGGYTGGGGRRQIAGVVHGQEFVVNADATRQWLPVLAAINSGKFGRVKGYREGGYVSMARAAWGDDEPYPRLRGGGAGQRAAMDAGRNGGMGGWDRRPHVSIGAIDNSVNAPFAESQQLRQVIAHQRDVERAMPDRIVAVVMKMLGRR